MKRGVALWLLLAGLAGALPACRSGGQTAGSAATPASAATVSIDVGGRQIVFRVEVAVTPAEHARGLMYRTRLDPDAGMIFVFEEPSVQTFWMKNTYIPLDMIFIGADRKIVGIVADAVPETETERRVGARAKYVLEIGGGLSAQIGIRRGQTVDLKNIPAP